MVCTAVLAWRFLQCFYTVGFVHSSPCTVFLHSMVIFCMACFPAGLHGISSAHHILHGVFCMIFCTAISCTAFSPLCFARLFFFFPHTVLFRGFHVAFCAAFLASHSLDSVFPLGVCRDNLHGQSLQAALSAHPSLRTGGRRWRAEPGARRFPTARPCWCARKPFGAKCCAREPTGTAGVRDSSTSSPATPVSAGGKLRHGDTHSPSTTGVWGRRGD